MQNSVPPALKQFLTAILFFLIFPGNYDVLAGPLEGVNHYNLQDSQPVIENLGPAVTQISIMTGHLADHTHFVFSRNTVPGELVGINVDTEEVTTQLRIQLGSDRSTEAFSMTSHDGYLYVGVRFEQRRLSIIRVDIETGEFDEVANLHPAQMARDMTVSPDGKIYAAMSQQYNARVYEYDPATESGRWIGSFATVNRQSAEAVVATNDHVYVGNGVSAPGILKYDRSTGDITSIIPEEYRQYVTEVFSLGLHDQWLVAGGRGNSSDPILALINLEDPSEYRLINHSDGLVQSIVVHEDMVYFGSGGGTWSYNINSEELIRISNLTCNRGLFYRDGVLHGTDGRRQIGMHDLTSGILRNLDLADVGVDEWEEPGQSMIYSDGVVYVGGHHAIGVHNIQSGTSQVMQAPGEAKHLIAVPNRRPEWSSFIYWGAYSGGSLIRYDPDLRQTDNVASTPGGDNRPRAVAYDEVNHFVLLGAQSDGAGAGSLTIYDIENDRAEYIRDPFGNHAVSAVTSLNGIAYLGSAQGRVDPGADARVAAWNPVTKEKIWEMTPVPGNRDIRSLIAFNNRILGLTRSGHLFVIDPGSQNVLHLERIITRSDAGRLRTKNNTILAASHDKIVSVDPETYDIEIIIDNLESRWFHWPDVAIGDNGEIFALREFDLISISPNPSKPVPVHPSRLSTVSREPVFSWEPASNAQQYQFQITESNFSTLLMDTTVSGESFEFPYKLKGGQAHRWRVRGIRKAGDSIITGSWSDEILFFTKEPTHIETEPGIPSEITLQQNYPNPFNASTTITYGLPERAQVTLRVYDVTGRMLKALVSSEQQAGYHSIPFNAEALASGVYILRLDVLSTEQGVGRQTSITRSLTLMK